MASKGGNIESLRTEKRSMWEFVEYKGCWLAHADVQGVRNMEEEFQSRDDDVILASGVKSGTTWMKAILFAIVNHSNEGAMKELGRKNPHHLVPIMEHHCFGPTAVRTVSALSEAASPRLLHTHVAYDLLPESVRTESAKCRVVYIARNPKDTFVSYWQFANRIRGLPPMDEAFDMFCSGVYHYGPFFNHVLGYWHASRNNSNVFFLTYEDLQADFVFHCKRLADFLGYSCLSEKDFTEIREKCSIESLSNMEGNKRGQINIAATKISNGYFFRKGRVGDWKNYFTPQMNERVDALIDDKFKHSDLQFTYELI